MWTDRNGTIQYRKTEDRIWPLAFHDRPVVREEDNVVRLKRRKG